MASPLKWCRFMTAIAAAALAAGALVCAGQTRAVQSAQGPDAAGSQPTILDRINQMLAGGKSAWTDDQIHTMERLRDAAMKSDYAYDELRHLTDNIGPRLSGSPQAEKAVDYVAEEMRARCGAEVKPSRRPQCRTGFEAPGDGRADGMARAGGRNDAENCADSAGGKFGNSA